MVDPVDRYVAAAAEHGRCTESGFARMAGRAAEGTVKRPCSSPILLTSALA
jgi:hypothetical protein